MNHEEYHELESFIHQYRSITQNLWYTWDSEAQKALDVLLNKSNHELSSYQRFNDLPEEKRYELFRNSHIRASVDYVYRKMQDYLSSPTWFDTITENNSDYNSLIKNPIAYFCAEYGLVDWMNIYSGGLGILAGDILKQASDLGIPFVAVGLLYQYGYFTQRINEYGYQYEEYQKIDPDKLPLTPIQISTGAPLLIEVTMIDHPVYCRIWTMNVGRVPLYLLDTNIPENIRLEDKLITGHLYGGDSDTRIRQEIVLGIGGERALSGLGLHPTVFSMNEGHSAFASLEITRHFMQERGMTFTRAREETKTKIIYTNHTLVPAGNDMFDYDLVYKYLSPYVTSLGIDFQKLYDLGCGCGPDGGKTTNMFSMPDLAFEMSVRSNAVSVQHGNEAKKMWPERDIIPITNGVHLPTWVNPKMQRLFEMNISPDWQHSFDDEELWKNALHIPAVDIWDVHTKIKEEMIEQLNEQYGFSLSPTALTISWARRFATYKRADIVIDNFDRLESFLNNADRPVQIIIGGKAHPHDNPGKDLMSRIINSTKDDRFKNKLVFVPNYQISTARALVAGSDVWLNNPVPFSEASGTSGMKAAVNGVLNCSTPSGWVPEMDMSDAGFMISDENTAQSFYDILEKNIIPLYFERDTHQIPQQWVNYMKNSVARACPYFSSKRTLVDYFSKLYTAAIGKQH
jgi:glycogen phosphorylase